VNRSLRLVLVLLGLSLGACASCKPKPNRVPPLCKYDVASENELAAKTLPAGTWLALASPSVDRQTMTRKGPLKDSCGRVVADPAADETMACPAARFETQAVSNDTLEEKDLLVAQVGGDKVVLWAATDEYVDGQAVGPVSLALWTEDGIEIHAAGVLRGFRTGARVRMHHASGIPVLVLESDRCTPDGKCTRIGQFVPVLARAAVAVGVAGVFMETHPDPANALSDGPNAWPLDRMRSLLEVMQQIDQAVKQRPFEESTL